MGQDCVTVGVCHPLLLEHGGSSNPEGQGICLTANESLLNDMITINTHIFIQMQFEPFGSDLDKWIPAFGKRFYNFIGLGSKNVSTFLQNIRYILLYKAGSQFSFGSISQMRAREGYCGSLG